ncbi:fused DSP-PTPase phosphatase/NAD kinase-like protein [Tuwongella immobilis]|uniref:Tyrosine specific protein phosphatases domain-containing protein n=1 Tax=Tuwongella immobilis TaxID=692036 RepID=A0A6C2YLG9_9BACT|nr:dual specificity protein phosphatase family protein [Tuwongella immobilis]VIP02418.1 protein phosphatase : Tyrosine phosphatase OS=Isosphaera pallida (strain ATCC 43644 / DSM 9630 / IS1B) GN=Isop_1943 PE=4 SV=1: Y_phosphatase2 [Tuwongella immobilis]VTS01339.1 protein phosphatase : Tyrosine phosphatase OS=Isosphaera pallida (strain ATCC 43644 / DSM 9630 / IS1B) GN=Isop_1943 PE=4 SV=1: Y_phosphatase2 [Tuwongella immobilis]
MPAWMRWTLALLISTMLVAVPWIFYRSTYAYSKRFREVTPGRFYRCGQLTAPGFRDVIQQFGIRTIINLQNEAPDPFIRESYFQKPSIRESEVCAQLGVKYILLEPDLLNAEEAPYGRPKVIEDYLKILDDPNAYPVLIHCKAGLHRTGLLTAIYRMEYEQWSLGESIRELKANGFGDDAATEANAYIVQYLQKYRPRSQSKPVVPAVPVSRTR